MCGKGGGSMSSSEDELINRYLDGQLSSEHKDELQVLLRDSAEARRKLRLFATVGESLAERSYEAPAQKVVRDWKNILPWGIAAAAILFASFSQFDFPKVNSKSDSGFLALLVDEAGAEFSESGSPDEVRFTKGEYRLEKGAVHLRFSNGADLLMKAPAAFEIDDAFNVRLHDGGVRAVVPPSAQGFTVATPGVDYEDLGTEFGLAVNGQTGASELHVFDGQVDAKLPGSDQLMSSVMEGESVAFASGKLSPAEAPDVDRFPAPGTIGFLRWEQQRQQISSDPDVVGYYPFIKGGGLGNHSVNAVAGDGDIQGARWVSGRWPGKSALLFDRDTDYVELDLPGEYEELSFATWLKIDRFDFSHVSIFDSNGWGQGDVHWQCNRSGSMWIAGFAEAGRKELQPRKIVPTGEWVHLVATISTRSRISKVYLNGEVAGAQKIGEGTLLAPGKSRLGNWLWDEEWPFVPIRAMRGRMDEFVIWKRALTENEIKELVVRGKPAALWVMTD